MKYAKAVIFFGFGDGTLREHISMGAPGDINAQYDRTLMHLYQAIQQHQPTAEQMAGFMYWQNSGSSKRLGTNKGAQAHSAFCPTVAVMGCLALWASG